MAHDEGTIIRTMELPTRKDFPSMPPRLLEEPKNSVVNNPQLKEIVVIKSHTESVVAEGHWKHVLSCEVQQSGQVEVFGEGRHKVSHKAS